ncbi:MAG: Na/Pi cotransporter family protein [Lachnospiraceae bacterium]|nr:Na/Pi cotransporter family protein [Lachnospiraceae bacterium]
MSIFSVFTLLGGLAFFIYGMHQMSNSLERIAGARMERIVNRMTKNRFAGLLMGCIITIAIQSSSAVTVMLVGLVNSGLMNIANTAGVIMGSNIGTTITAWVMSMIGISGDNPFVRMLKPESFSPVLAFVGILLLMTAKTQKKRDVGNALLGFAVLMYGMLLMSGSVAPLADSPSFAKVLTVFRNPVLGILIGLVITAIIQSSAASVGMLQALSLSGNITFGMAVPIIMGQNIGTCATAILSSIGVGRNAKRVAAIHLLFNLIGTAVFAVAFFGAHALFDLSFVDRQINPAGIALCHTAFNVGTTILLLPLAGRLVKLAETIIKTEERPQVAFLDERLFGTPALVVAKCDSFSREMAQKAKDSVEKAIANIRAYSEDCSREIEEIEGEVDIYEDHLGTYLVRLSGKKLSAHDSKITAKVLHSIGNFERLSDHALNLVESAKEIHEKKIEMSEQAKKELTCLENAVLEIMGITAEAYETMNRKLAEKVEPLEQVIDLLTETIRMNHIDRLQSGDCTIERGFVLADILNNFERISDHCSNIAIAVLEADTDQYDPHEYLKQIRTMDNPRFKELFEEYREKYSLVA